MTTDSTLTSAPATAKTGSSRRLLYVEPEAEGHHLAVYGAVIWEKMISEGWQITWLTSHHALCSPIAAELLKRFGTKIDVHPQSFLRLPNSGGRPLAWLRYQMHHRSLLNRVIPKIVSKSDTACIFMPWLNYCDRSCGLFGLPAVPVPIAALHMHVSIQEPLGPDASWIRRASRSVTKKSMASLYTQDNLKKIAVIIGSFAEFAVQTKMPGWEKVVYVPDTGSLGATASRIESRTHYSLDDEDVAILCFGALTHRKGVELLLKGADAANAKSKIVVILAGKQDREVEEMIARFRPRDATNPIRIVNRNLFVDATEERRLFAATDIVWVGYPGFLGSSGVLIQAGCASLPVISGKQGETGSFVRDAQCGITCDLSDSEEITSAIRTLSSDPELRSFMGKNGAIRSERHSPRIFAENILKIVEEAAGVAA